VPNGLQPATVRAANWGGMTSAGHWRGADDISPSEVKRERPRKMLEMAAESPAPRARPVRQLFNRKTRSLKTKPLLMRSNFYTSPRLQTTNR